MNRWPQALAIAMLALTAALPISAQQPPEPTPEEEPRPFARTRLEPGDTVTVGQPITVVVDVLVPNFFTAAPWFPTLDVDDAIAIYEDRGINFTEKIDGQSFAGQSRKYHIYPQRPGEFEIAEIPVPVRYLSDSGGPRTRATVSPPPVRFSAVIPPGAEGLSYFISTTGLDMDQSFDREPGTLKVAEAFVRTITVTVTDALSMVIPPLDADGVPGLAVYTDPPEVTDEGGERSQQIVGTRVERATYVAEQAGEYRLPPVELAWWDVSSREMKTTALPALEILVEPNPDLAVEIPLPADEFAGEEPAAQARQRVSLVDLLRRWGPPLVAVAILVYLFRRLGRRFGPGLRQRFGDARRERHESEAAYFARFRRAALSRDALATWNLWMAWLDRIHPGPGAATARTFVEAAADPDLDRQAKALDALLFAAGEAAGVAWSGKACYRAVARARRRRGLSSDPHRTSGLAPLTPKPLAATGTLGSRAIRPEWWIARSRVENG
jgi:hypothetical protein